MMRPMTPSMSKVVPQPMSWVTASTAMVTAGRRSAGTGGIVFRNPALSGGRV